MLKILLRTKCVEKGYKLSEKYINLIIDFYLNGVSRDTYVYHIGDEKFGSKKDFFRSIATIDNAKSRLKKMGIIENNKVSKNILPSLSDDEPWVLRLQVVENDNED